MAIEKVQTISRMNFQFVREVIYKIFLTFAAAQNLYFLYS